MEEYVIKSGKRLRMGYTTGTCAAAAAQAAAQMLLTSYSVEESTIVTPKGITLQLPILDISKNSQCVRCAVRKDGGDDPDVTDGALIYAQVSCVEEPGIHIDGGTGVGRVTKPGLDQPVGSAAINSVPRQMITFCLEQICKLAVYSGGLQVIISVPEGERLANKTFNPRLGIEGGISILGTTGIVDPMSEQALIDTIFVELKQRRASGAKYVLLTPGNYGADYIRDSIGVPETNAVYVSNYIGDALGFCQELGFHGALLVGHIGKLIKLAGGMMNTHSKYGDCRMEIMAAYAGAAGLDAHGIGLLLECVMCDEGLRILREAALSESVLERLSGKIGQVMRQRAGESLNAGAILYSRRYGYLCETEEAQSLLRNIKEEIS